jgi:DNA polymerase
MVDGGRIRGTLRFHGAGTGRWAGSGFQPHNLVRVQPADPEAAIAAVLSGDLARVAAIGPPLETLSTLSRSMICAEAGKTLIIADYSTVEPRVLSWLAGENWKLDGFRHFDATGDLAFENYCLVASRVFKRKITPDDTEDRQTGKYMELAFGYGGVLGAFRKIAPDADFTDAEVFAFNRDWRAAHPKTVQFWHDLHRALRRAVRTGAPVAFNKFKAEMRGGDLHLILPSDRAIVYPEARLEPGPYDEDQIIFKDNAKGKWQDYRGWHGTFTENVVQAISRDLLTTALQRVEGAGYPVVLHVHDDVVSEVPETFGSPEEFSRLMTELPPWAAGLPLAAKAERRQRYGKGPSAKPSTDSPSVTPGNGADREPEPIDDIDDGAALEPTVVVAVAQTKGADMMFAAAGSGEAPPWEGPATFDNVTAEAASPDPPRGNRRAGNGRAADGFDDFPDKKAGGKILCCFHDDHNPSLEIYPSEDDPHYHCWSCGAHGPLDELEKKGIDWRAELKAPTSKRSTGDDQDNEHKLERAHELWDKAVPIAGTLAERYLAETRGIDVSALPAGINEVLRFLPRAWLDGKYPACMIALFRDIETGERAGAHRIWLTPDAQKIERRMFGRWPRPRAIKLWPADDKLYVGEGIETVLAAATRLQMRPAWAMTTSGRLGKLPVISGITELNILLDRDANGEAAAATCCETWKAVGRRVRRLRVKGAGLNDFNDLILAKLRSVS